MRSAATCCSVRWHTINGPASRVRTQVISVEQRSLRRSEDCDQSGICDDNDVMCSMWFVVRCVLWDEPSSSEELVRSPEAKKGSLTTPSRVGRTKRLKSFQSRAVSQAAGGGFSGHLLPLSRYEQSGLRCAMECLSRDSSGWLSVSGSRGRSLIPHNQCNH